MMDEALCVVVLWSQKSVDSDWVRNEAQDGRDRELLVPVIIDDVKLPLEFRRIQTANLVAWPGSKGDLDVLIASINGCIEHGSVRSESWVIASALRHFIQTPNRLLRVVVSS